MTFVTPRQNFKYYEMVSKLFLLQFAILNRYFVKLARNDFHRNAITAQIVSLAFLVSAEKYLNSVTKQF